MSHRLHMQLVNNDLAAYYANKKSYAGDSGYDLYCPRDITVAGSSYATVDLQVRCSPQFDTPSGYYLYPRSSISKTPLLLANSVGIIDWGYRGNLMARVYNTSNADYTIKAGERLFQLCHPSLQPLDVSIVDDIDMTERGAGGFGSTGK